MSRRLSFKKFITLLYELFLCVYERSSSEMSGVDKLY